jgi:hypothetical protein
MESNKKWTFHNNVKDAVKIGAWKSDGVSKHEKSQLRTHQYAILQN